MQRLTQSFVGRISLIGLFLTLFAPSTFAQSSITIIQPTNGAVYPLSPALVLVAKITNIGTGVVPPPIPTNVSYFANSNLLGSAVQVVLDPPGINGVTGPVWELTWALPQPGAYALTAVAAYSNGTSIISQPVNITIAGIYRPRPIVRITSPPDHAKFFQPVDIPIFAFASAITPIASSNSLTTISNVEFYAGTNDLGPGQHVYRLPPRGTLPPIIILPDEYTITWSNALAGTWDLAAVATDDRGMMATSAPVSITVVPTQIITNGLDVVDIVATDPVAIEGTNCWIWPGLATAVPTWSAWGNPIWILKTNCGPKDATFMVRRCGENTNDLVVSYDVGGTASNGVDYAMLPGTVTIPAGKNYAFINVVPADTTLSAAVESVIVCLDPDTNAPPDYVVGKPPCAAAIILDAHSSYPPTGIVPGSLFHLSATGPDGAWFTVESSPDLVNWTPISTNQVVDGSIDFVDPGGTAAGPLYYQTVPQMNGPSQ